MDVRLPYNPAKGYALMNGDQQLPESSAPALLVSYAYLAPFLKCQSKLVYRDWVLDSGAFSAYNLGTVIDLSAYIETCKKLVAEDKTLKEIFALDVIGDWKASLRNTERMWAKGIQAIPCYHHGEPEICLLTMARDYPKIALGGVAARRKSKKLPWAAQCFARVWPKKIHGFGFGAKDYLMYLPWHSVDASSWEMGPCKYGNWASMGHMSIRGSNHALRIEIEYYLDMEREARRRWKKEMVLLESLDAPEVRLAFCANIRSTANLMKVEDNG